MEKSGFSQAIDRIKARDNYDAGDAGYKRLIKRIETEAKVARKAVDGLLAAGYTVGVNDGMETTVKRSTSVNEVMKALFTSEEDYLFAYDPKKEGSEAHRRVGWIRLIYGNGGDDVVSDYTTNLEAVMAPVNAYADTLAEG